MSKKSHIINYVLKKFIDLKKKIRHFIPCYRMKLDATKKLFLKTIILYKDLSLRHMISLKLKTACILYKNIVKIFILIKNNNSINLSR